MQPDAASSGRLDSGSVEQLLLHFYLRVSRTSLKSGTSSISDGAAGTGQLVVSGPCCWRPQNHSAHTPSASQAGQDHSNNSVNKYKAVFSWDSRGDWLPNPVWSFGAVCLVKRGP